MFLPELQIMHYKCFQCLSFTKSLIFCPKDQLAAKQQKSQKKTNQPGKRRWISRASDGRLLTDGAQCERGQDVTDVGALLPTGRPMHGGPRCNNLGTPRGHPRRGAGPRGRTTFLHGSRAAAPPQPLPTCLRAREDFSGGPRTSPVPVRPGPHPGAVPFPSPMPSTPFPPEPPYRGP